MMGSADLKAADEIDRSLSCLNQSVLEESNDEEPQMGIDRSSKAPKTRLIIKVNVQ